MWTVAADGTRNIGGVSAAALAEEFGTPLYVLVESEIRERLQSYREAMAIHYPRGRAIYAGKAFLTQAMAEIVAEEGLGLDVTSGGEIATALSVGFPPERLYFHGNAKSPAEVELALDRGLGRFMVDNFEEIELLGALAESRGRRAAVILRLTPGIEAHTHEYVRTGQLDSKFGFPLSEAHQAVRRVMERPGLSLKGFHAHIGSQILEVSPYRETVEVLFSFLDEVRRETGYVADEVDLGGGLGIRYQPEDDPPAIPDLIRKIGEAVRSACRRLTYPEPFLLVEPGRSVVGEAGATLYRVISVKEIPGLRTYVAVDGGMGDNPRPALYNAEHPVELVGRPAKGPRQLVTIAGRYCESGDILARDVSLPSLRPGDLLAVGATGAYTYSMAMNYNRVPRPAVVLIRADGPQVIVARETYEDLLRLDRRLEPASAVVLPRVKRG